MRQNRKKKGLNINGWLILDKPPNMTSTQALNKVKGITKANKAGHGGTLDPLATGVLPIAFGEATKVMAFCVDGEKEYGFRVRWGEARDTDDAEGEVTATSDRRPSEAEIHAILPHFIGEIEQTPPAFSAIKINGQRAYDLARDGQAPEMQPRQVRVASLELVAVPTPDTADFRIVCGKGTYVRAIARDMGKMLGCLGHLAALRRTRVGNFPIERAISLEKLEEAGYKNELSQVLLSVGAALDDIPACELPESLTRRLRHGQPIQLAYDDGALVRITSSSKLIAVGTVEDGTFQPQRVFNH